MLNQQMHRIHPDHVRCVAIKEVQKQASVSFTVFGLSA